MSSWPFSTLYAHANKGRIRGRSGGGITPQIASPPAPRLGASFRCLNSPQLSPIPPCCASPFARGRYDRTGPNVLQGFPRSGACRSRYPPVSPSDTLPTHGRVPGRARRHERPDVSPVPEDPGKVLPELAVIGRSISELLPIGPGRSFVHLGYVCPNRRSYPVSDRAPGAIGIN